MVCVCLSPRPCRTVLYRRPYSPWGLDAGNRTDVAGPSGPGAEEGPSAGTGRVPTSPRPGRPREAHPECGPARTGPGRRVAAATRPGGSPVTVIAAVRGGEPLRPGPPRARSRARPGLGRTSGRIGPCHSPRGPAAAAAALPRPAPGSPDDPGVLEVRPDHAPLDEALDHVAAQDTHTGLLPSPPLSRGPTPLRHTPSVSRLDRRFPPRSGPGPSTLRRGTRSPSDSPRPALRSHISLLMAPDPPSFPRTPNPPVFSSPFTPRGRPGFPLSDFSAQPLPLRTGSRLTPVRPSHLLGRGTLLPGPVDETTTVVVFPCQGSKQKGG